MGTLIENKFGLFRKYLEAFIILNDEEWQIFQSHLRFKNLHKKELFSQAGTVCNDIAFIVSGLVRYFVVKDGQQRDCKMNCVS